MNPSESRGIDQRRRRKIAGRAAAFMVLLIVIGYAIRVAGAGSSIAYIPDTQIIREGLQMGQELAGERGVLEAKYPFTLPGYLMFTYVGLLGIHYLTGTVTSLSGFTDYLYANRETIHVVSVWSLNLINVALIPVVYLLAKRLLSQHSGWLAAGMATLNLLLVQFSHQARPHVPLTTLSTLAILLLIHVAYHANWKWCAAAAIISALTVGTLQNGVLIAAPFVLAFFARGFDSAGVFSPRRLFSLTNLACIALFAALSFVLSPSILSEVAGMLNGILSNPDGVVALGAGGHQITGSQFQISSVGLFISYLMSYQPVLTLLFPVAFPYLIWRLRRQIKLLAVLLPFWVGNLVVWALYEGVSPRVTAVTIPLFILAAAFFIEDLALAASEHFKLRPLVVRTPVMLAILLPTAVTTLRLVNVTAQPDTRSLASAWIIREIPAETTVLTNFAALELPATRESLARQEAAFPGSLGTQQQWMLTQPDSVYPAASFDVINNRIYNYPIDNSRSPLLDQPHIALLETASSNYDELPAEIMFYMANSELLETICPGTNMAYVYLPEDLTHTGWRDIWEVEHPGTIVLIFRYQPTDQRLLTPEERLQQQPEPDLQLCAE